MLSRTMWWNSESHSWMTCTKKRERTVDVFLATDGDRAALLVNQRAQDFRRVAKFATREEKRAKQRLKLTNNCMAMSQE